MPETVLLFDRETKRLSIRGTREEAETGTVSGEILEYLQAVVELKTEPQITEAVEGKTKFVRKALRQLVEQGKLSREGGGKRGDPYRYRFLFSCSQDIAGTREQ
jgi:predicted HTH transcriptional regulator